MRLTKIEILTKYISDQEHSKTATLKLLYICFGYYGAKYKKHLFTEDILAWDLGPVVQEAYDFLEIPKTFNQYSKADLSKFISQNEVRIIDEVLSFYGKKYAYELVNLTHEKGSPWFITYKNGKGKNNKIDKQLIIDYYTILLQARDMLSSGEAKKVMIEFSKT